MQETSMIEATAKQWFNSNGLNGVISLKINLFKGSLLRFPSIYSDAK
jgi:hypothetical protein